MERKGEYARKKTSQQDENISEILRVLYQFLSFTDKTSKRKVFFPFVITNVKGRHLLESTGCVTPLSPSPRNINLAVANISGNSFGPKIDRRIVMEDAQSNLHNSETVGNHLRYVYLGLAWQLSRKVKEKGWLRPS